MRRKSVRLLSGVVRSHVTQGLARKRPRPYTLFEPLPQYKYRPFATYTSKHYQVSAEDIENFLERRKRYFKLAGEEYRLRECHLCPKPHKDHLSNLYKLSVNRNSGLFHCFRCGSSGSWFDFKNSFSGGLETNIKDLRTDNNDSVNDGSNIPDQEKCRGYLEALFDEKSEVGREVYKYLTEERKLGKETLRKYGVGAAEYRFSGTDNYETHPCVTFPWVSRVGEFVSKSVGSEWRIARLKVRSVREKRCQRLDPKGGSQGFFGWHIVPPNEKEIIITEGEFDAMAVHEKTGRTAISLPNGANSFPPALIPALERFDKIILWLDSDAAGQQGLEKIVKKLGRRRCYIVNSANVRDGHSVKDANEALIAELDLNEFLLNAEPVPHNQVLSMSKLRSTLLHEIENPSDQAGVPFTSFPGLNGLLKGHRRGEITILTGPTGSGKTTLLSQLSLDLCIGGVRTMWGSFEIPNNRLLSSMLDQYIGRPDIPFLIPEDTEPEIHERKHALAHFSDLPLYCMGFFGSTDVDEVLDAMEHAVYVHDVEHVILDNLQFMIQTGKNGRAVGGFNKFDAQDEALQKFRSFATKQQVHVTIVIHPKKEADNSTLSVSSVFGSAKATQEADNVLIMQRFQGNEKSVQVKKNRFDGDLGDVPLKFIKGCKSYADMSLAATEARRKLDTVANDDAQLFG